MPTFALGKRSSASSVNWTFTSGWRASAWAQTLTSRSVTVTRTSGSSSRTRSTSAFARVISAETTSSNAGTVHAAVSRRAIVLRIVRQRDRLDLAGHDRRRRAAAAPREQPARARRPRRRSGRPGRCRVTDESSIPRSRAIRRASGEALIRPPFVGAAAGRLGVAQPRAAASRPASRSGSRTGASAGFSALRGASGSAIETSSPCLADHRDGLSDRNLARGDGDLQQDARGLGLDLLGHLVGVELVERLALLDGVALALEPADDRARLHALAEPRELDLVRHR